MITKLALHDCVSFLFMVLFVTFENTFTTFGTLVVHSRASRIMESELRHLYLLLAGGADFHFLRGLKG